MYWLIIAILVINFAYRRTLSLLNTQASHRPVPDLLADLYDSEKYAKQQNYMRVNSRFGLILSTFDFLLMIIFFACGGYAWLDELVRTYVSNSMVVSLVFFGILFFVSEILDLPAQLYRTFSIEQRFGFNKVTPKLFVLDTLKGWGLSLVLGGVLLTAIMAIYDTLPHYFWLLAWGVVTLFGLFMNFFYSEWIVPLFNKQTPLPAGDLRNAIESFAQKNGFALKNIYVIDGSKRSTKANAYFSGWGRKKRIVLYDTLIDQLTIPEIVAVLAHEMGHNKHKHTLRSMLLSLPINLLMFGLLGWALSSQAIAQAAGCAMPSFHVNMLIFGMLYSPISTVFDLLLNIRSRHFEYQADAFVKTCGLGNELASSLKKISAQALSNLTPHPLCVFMEYSHPTLYQRIVKLL